MTCALWTHASATGNTRSLPSSHCVFCWRFGRWNWPFKFGGLTAANATALATFESMIAEMDWLWKRLDIFLPDLCAPEPPRTRASKTAP